MEPNGLEKLITPLSDYPTVTVSASLKDAICTLEQARERDKRSNPDRYWDRAVLVVDEGGQVIGKLSMLRILEGLEPRYLQGETSAALSRASARVGAARENIDSIMEGLSLWQDPLHELASKADRIRVAQLVTRPSPTEIIPADAALGCAIHRMIAGHHQSLLVKRDGRIVGVLRLSDVFQAVRDLI